jgi:predicted negative regulator of RcsB-dependent stress response
MRLILQKTIQNILVSVAGFLVFIILSFDTLAAGRTLSREDSLHKALGTTVDANSKVWLYISLAELLKDRSPDSSIKYLDEARQIFWQINAMPYLGKVFEIKGEISRNQNKSKEAIRQYGIAAFCYQRQGKLQNQMEILNQIGNLYAHSDDIAEAFNS